MGASEPLGWTTHMPLRGTSSTPSCFMLCIVIQKPNPAKTGLLQTDPKTITLLMLFNPASNKTIQNENNNNLGKADCLKELNVSEDATPYGSEFQTLIEVQTLIEQQQQHRQQTMSHLYCPTILLI